MHLLAPSPPVNEPMLVVTNQPLLLGRTAEMVYTPLWVYSLFAVPLTEMT